MVARVERERGEIESTDYKLRYKGNREAANAASSRFLTYTESREEPHEKLVPSLLFGIETARKIPRTHELAER